VGAREGIKIDFLVKATGDEGWGKERNEDSARNLSLGKQYEFRW
jgi:hypothetical protein